jgi:Lrp/AsnC family transcriptional regulator, leucine-responsive regulatory protein
MNLQNDAEKLLDATGWQIIQALQENARLSYHELGRRVGLTAPAVAERVRKLEDAGVIMGYTARINPALVGLPITVFIRLSATPTGDRGMKQLVKTQPEILECHRVTGGDSFIMKVVVTSIAHLEALIHRLMEYSPSISSIVLSSPVEGKPILQETTRMNDIDESPSE